MRLDCEQSDKYLAAQDVHCRSGAAASAAFAAAAAAASAMGLIRENLAEG